MISFPSVILVTAIHSSEPIFAGTDKASLLSYPTRCLTRNDLELFICTLSKIIHTAMTRSVPLLLPSAIVKFKHSARWCTGGIR